MHAEEGKPCRETGCEFFRREIKAADTKSSAMKVVRRKSNAATKPTTAGKPEPHRATKKANLKKPFKWGGRSGSNF